MLELSPDGTGLLDIFKALDAENSVEPLGEPGSSTNTNSYKK